MKLFQGLELWTPIKTFSVTYSERQLALPQILRLAWRARDRSRRAILHPQVRDLQHPRGVLHLQVRHERKL